MNLYIMGISNYVLSTCMEGELGWKYLDYRFLFLCIF